MAQLVRSNRALSRTNLTAEEKFADEARSQRARQYRLEPHGVPSPRIEFHPGEFKMAGRQLYFSERHKLVICAIPKVASTELIKLIYRLDGDPKWFREPHFRSDAPTLATLSRDEATDIMNDPRWTKAVFLRDPLTRLLSAYLDKFVLAPKRGLAANYGVKHFGSSMSFETFIDAIASNITDKASPYGLHLGTNPHWKPQRYQCSLEKFLPVFSFIGRYENIREHAETLLRAANLWDDFGKSGWAPTFVKRPISPHRSLAEHNASNDVLRDAIFARAAAHGTNAKNRYRDYYRLEQEEDRAPPMDQSRQSLLEHRATEAYAYDYELLRVLDIDPLGLPVTGATWTTFLREHPHHRRLCHLDSRAFGPDYCPPETDRSASTRFTRLFG